MIFESAILKLVWSDNDERRYKYETSATEQEIIKGVLNPPDHVPNPEEHVFTFFREIENKSTIFYNDISKDFFDFNDNNELDKYSDEKLDY